jgi:Protein of unknown function (DUF1565)
MLKTIILILFWMAGSGSAATYWVSTAGSDSNNGSWGTPFRHLSRAAAAASHPGDIVMVMDGTYDNEGQVGPNNVVNLQYSGTSKSPITFVAQDRGQVILDSENTATGTTCNGASAYFNLGNVSYIVIQGFVIQHACNDGITSLGTAHDVTIRWNEICYIANHTVTDQYGRDGIYMNGSQYNFVFDGNSFHDIGRTNGTPLLHYDHGIYSQGQNLTITNNIFYNMNRGWSIQLANGASNWIISNNTFAFGNANGEPGQIEFWENNSQITVQNNIFYMPNVSALNQYETVITGSLVQSNVVYGVSALLPNTIIGSIAGLVLGSNLIGVNPMFVNASAPPYNFALQPGSPAAGNGMMNPTITVDFTGKPRQQPSIGAFGKR